MSFGIPVRNGLGIGLKASTTLSTRGGASGPAGGQQAYTVAGTYSWVAPVGITSVSAVVVGGGGGFHSVIPYSAGGGGGLAYKNNMAVTPESSYTVIVGSGGPANSNGEDSSFSNGAITVTATGGIRGNFTRAGGTPSGTFDGGGTGGLGGLGASSSRSQSGGGGGAGGYSGNGGNGGTAVNSFIGSAGSGGAGGGGGGGYGGGGVGILGEGTSGASSSAQGNAGSGGVNINYGGGATVWDEILGPGAVRIIWPGTTRSFPSTGTGNL